MENSSDGIDNKLLRKELKILREEALAILRTKGLVGDEAKVPVQGDENFSGGSFDEYFHKNSYRKYFDEWTKKVSDLFDRANLDFILLNNRVGVELGDKKKQPAAVFSAMVTELDKMIDDEKKLDNYFKESSRYNSWPHLTYSNGTIYQGLDKRYKPQKDLIKRFFDLMWERRRIISPMDSLFVLQYEKPITREELFKSLGITRPDRLTLIIDAVNSAADRKKMNITVKSPDSETVYIEVKQDLVSDRP